MSPETRARIVADVYADEIVATGLDRWWDLQVYEALVAQIPRHDASMAEQLAFVGPDDLPWEPGDMERPA